MNCHFLRVCFLVCGVFIACGCQEPRANRSGGDASIEGLTLADLQPHQSQQANSEFRLSISVLTYQLDVDSLDQLSRVYRVLSKRGIDYENKSAFNANGFSVGLGMHQKGGEVARALTEIGAAQTGHARVTIPTETHEAIFSVPVPPQSMTFPMSHRTRGGVTLGAGQLGWIFSAQKDPTAPGILAVQVEPAFWEQGLADLRLLSGEVPLQFKTFDVGRFYIKLQPGQFFVLGPAGAILRQQTLSQKLFTGSERDRGQVFVVILQKAGPW